MTRCVVVLILLLALAGLTGCLVYGGGGYYSSYSPQYVCYDVVVDYFWNGYQWVPIYETVCQWESLTPEQIGDQEIAGVYASDGNVLTPEPGATDVAVGQVIELRPAEGDSSFILVEAVSKPEKREVKE